MAKKQVVAQMREDESPATMVDRIADVMQKEQAKMERETTRVMFSDTASPGELTQQSVAEAIQQAADATLESRVASALTRAAHQDDWLAQSNAADAKERREARRDGFIRAALQGILSCPNLGYSTDDAAANAIRCADEVMARLEAE